MTAVSVSIWPSAIVRLRRPTTRIVPGRGGGGPTRDSTSIPRAWSASGDSSIGSVIGANPATTTRDEARNRCTGPGGT